jgi:hypothetical protein
MAMKSRRTQWGLHARLCMAMAGVALCSVLAIPAQEVPNAPEPIIVPRERALPDRLAEKPSQPPAFRIPVGPLGFSAPGALYLGQRNSLVSLDFLDEDRLLFTFRVPGLVHREAGEGEERQIRAVVLKLPEGTVEAEALWKVHDRQRYLWALSGGRFLLRDRNNLEMGDLSLELKPFLRFPGPLLWLELDPTQQFLVTNSREPETAENKPNETANSANRNGSEQKPDVATDLAVRILRRDSGKVILVSHSHSTVHLPINSDGYLSSVRGRGDGWMLNLNYFNGGSNILGRVESSCSPLFDFLSQREVLVTTCTPRGTEKLVAMTTDGRELWNAQTSDEAIWPLVVRSPDGSRLAREALAITHPISARSTLSQDDIKGQLVEVINAVDGRVVLEAAASPILDAGGNVAISPSGSRVAILNGGAIQVFELPAPTRLPDSIVPPAGR